MVVSASEQFVGTCDHLTDYCFVRSPPTATLPQDHTLLILNLQNVLSFQTNNSMERLSIVTVVFLRTSSICIPIPRL
jgi:hypothetical protein